MTKQAFLDTLRSKLSGLPQEELEERLGFYSEMIDDRMEEGVTQEDAVAAVGEPDEIVTQILADVPLAKLVKEKVKPKRRLRAWEIVLLIVGSPLWLSLLIAAAAILLSVYIVLWSLIISLWAIEAAFAASALASAAAAVILAVSGSTGSGIAALGAGCTCAGLAIFLFFGCKAATKGIIKLTKLLAIGTKKLFIGKEGNHEQYR